MDVVPDSSTTSSGENDFTTCVNTTSALWLQNRLLRDQNLSPESVLACPLLCGDDFPGLMALVDHIPLCQRLSRRVFWCWRRRTQLQIPILCRCHQSGSGRITSTGGHLEQTAQIRPSSSQSPMHSTASSLWHQNQGQNWISQHVSMSSAPRAGLSDPQIHPHQQPRYPSTKATAFAPVTRRTSSQRNDILQSMLSNGPVTSPENGSFSSTNLIGFGPANLDPRTEPPVSSSPYCRSPGVAVEEVSMPETWTSVANLAHLSSGAFAKTAQDSLGSITTGTRSNLASSAIPQFHDFGGSVTPSTFMPLSIQLPTHNTQIAAHSESQALQIQSNRASESPSVSVALQRGLLAQLKACFYTVLPQGPTENPILLELTQYVPHQVLGLSLLQLMQLTTKRRLKEALPRLLVAYLSLAMAMALQKHLKVELPSCFTENLQADVNHLLNAPESTDLGPWCLSISHSFLDVFQVYLEEELRTPCGLTCACRLPAHAARTIMSNIRDRFPTVHTPDTKKYLSPTQFLHTIRSLELGLLRLRPQQMPCSILPDGSSEPELSTEVFFTEYVDFVRDACSPYYCQHLSRARYHVWVTRLMWAALGAQKDAPLRPSAPRELSKILGTTCEEESGASASTTAADGAPSPALVPKQDSSPAPPNPPQSTSSSPSSPRPPPPLNPRDQQYLACPERGCNYIALGSNAKKLLRRHKEALHNPNKQRLPCQYCNKDFTRKDNLKVHIMKKHTPKGTL